MPRARGGCILARDRKGTRALRLQEAAVPSEAYTGRVEMWRGLGGACFISKRRTVRMHRRMEWYDER